MAPDYTELLEKQFPGIFDTKTGGNLTFYHAPDAIKDAPLMIVLPGGGYTQHGWTETEVMAKAWNEIGYAVFLLRYSLVPDAYPAAVRQACGTIALAKLMPEKFGIDPKKVYVIGFSAGGHLVGCAETFWNRPEVYEFLGVEKHLCRPDAAIPAYAPVTVRRPLDGMYEMISADGDLDYIAPALYVDDETPPTFIWQTSNDSLVDVQCALDFSKQLAKHGIIFENHTYYSGFHGLSLCKPESGWIAEDYTDERIGGWIDLCDGWLKTLPERSAK